MADNGILWSIRYYGQGDSSVKAALARELDRILDEFEADGLDWSSKDLAEALVADMDLKPSGAAEHAITPERVGMIRSLMPDQLFEQGEYEEVIKAVLKSDQEARRAARERHGHASTWATDTPRPLPDKEG